MPIDLVERLDGTIHAYDVTHYVTVRGADPAYRESYDRVWMAGALLTLGDALEGQNYFDKRPDLEIVRHLRNGIAHGNRFNLLHNEPRRPAFFKGPDRRAYPDGSTTAPGSQTYFEVTPSLDGKPVLFTFMGPGDVLDLLLHLSSRAGLWPQ